MGNTCQQQAHNAKYYDEKHTVDSQEYFKPEKKQEYHASQVKPKKKESKVDIAAINPGNDSPYTFIRRPAPNFQGMAYYNSGFKKISLRDFKGQYVVLFFFPFDFNEVCKKEILAFSELNGKFQKAACQVIGCSQDSQFAHMQFSQKKKEEGGLGALEIPLLSDVDKQISTSYGVVIEDGEVGEKGAAFRSTFIIDTNQILRHMSINDISISVNPDEILRLVHTFQQHDRENPLKGGNMGGCPFGHHAKEQPDIDTFSKYNRKKSEDESNKNESAKQDMKSEKKSMLASTYSRNEANPIPLITRLGGELVVQEIADKFVNELFGDETLKPFFGNKTTSSKQKKAVGHFLKVYFGAPQQYTGMKMADAHKDLGLNDDHFNKASEYFKKILKEDLKKDQQLVQEVMMYIEPLRSQITQKPTQSLYQRVKGDDGIRKAVQQYFNKILLINEIKPIFSKVDPVQVQEQYVQYLALVFGGPSKYKGKQMREAHSNFHIPEKLFNYCVVQIQSAFKENGVDTNSINEIGRLLECLRSEIPRKTNTLIDRLGGVAQIEKAVKKIYEDKINNEPKIKDFFKAVDMKSLGQRMTDYYIMIAGGPNKYTGKTAKDAHHKFNIMSSQFEVYKAMLRDTFQELGSSKESVAELINLIDTIKVDVIGGKPPSLFEKAGGDEFVNTFTDRLFDEIMKEKRIRHYFINVELKSVISHFKEYLNMASGGSIKYQGENIRDHHEQMDIDNKDYNVFMEVIKKTVGTFTLKEELVVELVNFFENMRTMIVSVVDD